MRTGETRQKVRHKQRNFWIRQIHQWHWISAAICLIGMILFAFTGITLNHAGQLEGRPIVTSWEATLPPRILAEIPRDEPPGERALPKTLADWLSSELPITLPDRLAEWSRDEIYLSLPRPGGDAWLNIDLAEGKALYEKTDRGWISYLNDLHKGRNTGAAWRWFIDVFAVACLIFSITGLFLLQVHAERRPFTWPAVALGLAIPMLIAVVSIHL